jgi:hypothetical protein
LLKENYDEKKANYSSKASMAQDALSSKISEDALLQSILPEILPTTLMLLFQNNN